MVFARSETLVGFLRALREGITDGVAPRSDEGPISGGTWETHYACVWREGCGTQPRDYPPGGVATFIRMRSKVLKSIPGRSGRCLSQKFGICMKGKFGHMWKPDGTSRRYSGAPEFVRAAAFDCGLVRGPRL